MKLALAGDTMLGRRVADQLALEAPEALFSDDVVAVAHEADLFLVNLECAISDRGRRWPSPAKPFFFRAPPVATDVLRRLGVGCVTLANNHALDYGTDALEDTVKHLHDAGIEHVGAGSDVDEARAPLVIERAGTRVGIIGVTDHPADFAARPDRGGVAFADLRQGVPDWLRDAVRTLDADVVLVTPHWGPNMVVEPVPHVRRAADELREIGATLIAGHSAHVFHGVEDHVLFDLGDLIDDYARHPVVRNDVGLLWLVTIEDGVPTRLEAVPLGLDYCRTTLADAEQQQWVVRRFRHACAALGTQVEERGRRLVIDWT